jgi:flavin reductase (DIM6/NTAB) family NADH-FMN oxidoreductase RutF
LSALPAGRIGVLTTNEEHDPMSIDLQAAAWTLSGLRPYPVAITTVADGRANGLIALSAGSGSVVPEAPRVVIGLTTFNLTHDMVMESGVFAMHLLAGAPEQLLGPSLDIIMALGGRSGRDGDKLSGLRTKEGVTGSPILLDALSYVEGRVVGNLVNEENTIFLADVVASERLQDGKRLTIGEAWGRLPPEWVLTYEANHLAQENAARVARGLPPRAAGEH